MKLGFLLWDFCIVNGDDDGLWWVGNIFGWCELVFWWNWSFCVGIEELNCRFLFWVFFWEEWVIGFFVVCVVGIRVCLGYDDGVFGWFDWILLCWIFYWLDFVIEILWFIVRLRVEIWVYLCRVRCVLLELNLFELLYVVVVEISLFEVVCLFLMVSLVDFFCFF